MSEGHKRTKGVPELHDELKTRVNLSLTPTAVKGLDAIAAELGISRSELVEHIGRRKILLANQRDLGNVDPKVYAFIEQAVRDLPLIETTRLPVEVMLFKDRHELPSSPGAYIVSDWYSYIERTTKNLREGLSKDSPGLERFIDRFGEYKFIVWQSFQDSRILEFRELALEEVSYVYRKLKKEIYDRTLQKTVNQINSEFLGK